MRFSNFTGAHQRRDLGDRHRAVGHQGQMARRADLRAAGRENPRQGARLRPLQGPHTEKLLARAHASGRGLHGARLHESLSRRGFRSPVEPLAYREDAPGDRQRAPRARGGRPGVDICIEIHCRMNPAEAVTLGRALEPYPPMFLEDPIRPDSIDAMAWVPTTSPSRSRPGSAM